MQGDKGLNDKELDKESEKLSPAQAQDGDNNLQHANLEEDSARQEIPFRGKPVLEDTMPSLAGIDLSDEEIMQSRSNPAPLVGQVIDNQFKILEVLGQGGMSVVYKALYIVLSKTVAIKTMHKHLVSDTNALLRFKQEAQAAIQLDHPNVIKVYHFGITGGEDSRPYIVMDYIEGISFSELLKKGEALPVNIVLKIFIQACNALAHAHKKGIIHRDLKPSNIMLLDRDGDPYVVKIVDFGIAKLLPQEGEQAHRLTQTGEIFGSPMYMSPEQCMGRSVDKRSDIYALGCVLYEALCGKPPHLGNNVFETFHKHISEIPASLEIPDADKALVERFDAIVFKALEKDPDKRYQSMTDLEEDLRAIERDLDSGLRGTGLRLGLARQQRSLQRLARQTPKLVILISSLLFFMTVAAFAFWFKFAWFFQEHEFQPVPTHWLDFQPSLHAKLELSADERQRRLDLGKTGIFRGQANYAEYSDEMLHLWQQRAKFCAELGAEEEEFEARDKVIQILEHRLRTKNLQKDFVYGDAAEKLAECLIAKGDLERARTLLEEAVLIREQELHPSARNYISLAYLYSKAGALNRSISMATEALNLLGNKKGGKASDARQAAVARSIMGDDYKQFASMKAAAGNTGSSPELDRAKNLLPGFQDSKLDSLDVQGSFIKAGENYEEAEKVINSSSSLAYKSKNMLNELALAQAYTLLLTGNYEKAASKYGTAISLAETRLGGHPELLKAIFEAYAYSAWKCGDILTAAQMQEKAESITKPKDR